MSVRSMNNKLVGATMATTMWCMSLYVQIICHKVPIGQYMFLQRPVNVTLNTLEDSN